MIKEITAYRYGGRLYPTKKAAEIAKHEDGLRVIFIGLTLTKVIEKISKGPNEFTEQLLALIPKGGD